MSSFAVFWTKADGGKWIKSSEGKLPDKLCQKDKALAECLTDCNFPLIDAPSHIVAAAEQRISEAGCITPSRIRTAIRKPAGLRLALKTGSLDARLKASSLSLLYLIFYFISPLTERFLRLVSTISVRVNWDACKIGFLMDVQP